MDAQDDDALELVRIVDGQVAMEENSTNGTRQEINKRDFKAPESSASSVAHTQHHPDHVHDPHGHEHYSHRAPWVRAYLLPLPLHVMKK